MRALGWLGLAIAIVVGGTLLYLDWLVKTAIEKGAEVALGVETSVDAVRPGLITGRLAVSGLTVSNPGGFESPHFLDLRQGRLAVGLASLRTRTVEVSEIRLDGVDLYLERRPGAGTNYAAILDRVGGKRSRGGAEDRGGRSFVVRQLSIHEVTARLRLAPELGRLTSLDVSIPEIRLRNLGAEGRRGVGMAELTTIVVRAILEAVLRKGGDLGPIGADLQAGLRGLGRVPSEILGSVKRIGEGARGIEQGAGEALRGLGDWLRRKDPE